MQKTAASLLLLSLLLAAEFGLFDHFYVKKPADTGGQGIPASPGKAQWNADAYAQRKTAETSHEKPASPPPGEDQPSVEETRAPGPEPSSENDRVLTTMASKSFRSIEPTEAEEKETKVWPPDQNGVQGAFRESLATINECYTAWLQAETSRNLEGTIEVEFTIEPDAQKPASGKVTDIHIANSELNHKALEACVISIVANFSFAAPPKPQTVQFPLNFHEAP